MSYQVGGPVSTAHGYQGEENDLVVLSPGQQIVGRHEGNGATEAEGFAEGTEEPGGVAEPAGDDELVVGVVEVGLRRVSGRPSKPRNSTVRRMLVGCRRCSKEGRLTIIPVMANSTTATPPPAAPLDTPPPSRLLFPPTKSTM